MNATVHVHDRAYTSWSLFDQEVTLSKLTYDNVNPIQSKLFNGDQILIHEGNQATLVMSPTRKSTFLAGVLILNQNKTYGRTTNKKRLLYRVIPEQKQLPYFLVPYDVKLSFNKSLTNKYVLFRFESWEGEHPFGQITEVLGDVAHLESYYEYQLYCKCLHSSLKDMTRRTKEMVRHKTSEEYICEILEQYPNIQDRTDVKNIITIDPLHSVDYDDALSIHVGKDTTIITTYITKVFIWLEALNLWNAFSNRTSTIYLPDKKRPMLPSIISDSLCSLQANTTRFAFAVDFTVQNSTSTIIKYDIVPVMIRVNANYTYCDLSLLENVTYNALFNVTTKIQSNDYHSISSSHELVSYWMIATNKSCATFMASHQRGIYRTMKSSPTKSSEKIIQNWLNSSGQYVEYDGNSSMEHCFLKASTYIQITSPMRRVVDLLNQITLFELLSDKSLSETCQHFMQQWTSRLDYINTSARSIRKLQINCALLHRFIGSPEAMERSYRGFIFDKVEKANGMFGYMVYLEEIKLLSRTTSEIELESDIIYNFKVYLFENEESTNKKIRVELFPEHHADSEIKKT